ncbi:glycoside hydrolase family 57 protein [Thermofilum pendens]|uniref:Alpha-amylase n=1 Tax=Thermofilum pendens (strain DSM 2475 / Hrk 5) TaxID=368408 RepID=A1RWG5_THEPD|nr:glycoside hydrolase family 57 protein [Thermofilum pendens]ABL77545.1 Alpha-amylase [Thermofilum pendens Hrk 5]
MKHVVFMFEVHQPYRLSRNIRGTLSELTARKGKITAEDLERVYFDDELNRRIFERVSKRCYLPANNVIRDMVEFFKDSGKPFKVSYSLSGVLLEQAEKWYPEVIESFRSLAKTGMVEFLDQTYYHSLAFLFAEEELLEQVREHREALRKHLGVEPTAVENTEFTYNNYLACLFDKLGYKVILTEGVERVLGWRSPNYLYKAKGCNIRVLMRNYRLSDDIGFRFGARWWSEYPLTADKYSAWLSATPGEVILVAIDYETFGEHFPAETGIFEFLRWLPGEILKWGNLVTSTPSEVAERLTPRDEVDVPVESTISWADLERDLSAWIGNFMQNNAFTRMKDLWLQIKAVRDRGLERLWKLLSISDHYYYMSTKGGGPGDVHSYFSPYGSPFEAYMFFSEALGDLETRTLLRLESDETARLRYAWMKDVPREKVFAFYRAPGQPLGRYAWNMFSFINALREVPLESVLFHQERGDFASWVEYIVGDHELAERLRRVGTGGSEEVRSRILEVIERRRAEIFG